MVSLEIIIPKVEGEMPSDDPLLREQQNKMRDLLVRFLESRGPALHSEYTFLVDFLKFLKESLPL